MFVVTYKSIILIYHFNVAKCYRLTLLLKAATASSDGRQDNFNVIVIYIHGKGIFIFSLQCLLYIHVYFCDDYFLFLNKNIFQYEKRL